MVIPVKSFISELVSVLVVEHLHLKEDPIGLAKYGKSMSKEQAWCYYHNSLVVMAIRYGPFVHRTM